MKARFKMITTFILVVILFTVLFFNVPGSKDADQRCLVSQGTPVLRVKSNSINITSPENKTYYGPMGGYYPASHGFENSIVGTFPDGWVDLSGSPSWVRVVAARGEHTNVLRFTSYFGSVAAADQDFTPQTSGTIELWVLKEPFCDGPIIIVALGNNATNQNAIRLLIDDSNYPGEEFYANGYGEFADGIYHDDQWFHLRLDFDCTTDKYDIYLDGIQMITQADFWFGQDWIDGLRLGSSTGGISYYYVDALSYSWDPNYNISDNFNTGLLLNFTTGFTPNWTAYSLDGQPNRTIPGNVTLPMPSNGAHSLQVFGNDSIGTPHASDVQYFEIADTTVQILSNSAFSLYASGGNGSAANPYILENYVINASGMGRHGIYILNTNAHFIIRNCTITNADTGFAGICLANVTNGNLLNNTAASNSYGIKISLYSENNIVANNTCDYNVRQGIFMTSSTNNSLEGNTADHASSYDGIYLQRASNNTLINNTVNYNGRDGIFLNNQCNNNTLINNSAKQNARHGIVLSLSDNNNLTNNNANNNSQIGIYLGNSNNNNIAWNILYDNLHSIRDINGIGNVIENNDYQDRPADPNSPIDIYDIRDFDAYKSQGDGSAGDPFILENYVIGVSGLTTHGILIQNTDAYFIIRNCTISNTVWNYAGIYLINVQNGHLTDNVMSHLRWGIRLVQSSYINLTSNVVYDNEYGIYLGQSDNNLLRDNNASYNRDYGILLDTSHNNDLISNIATSTTGFGIWITGIVLVLSDNNDLFTNIATNNARYGLQVSTGSDSNYFYRNLVWQNTISQIEDGGAGNTWIDNQVNSDVDYDGDGLLNGQELSFDTNVFMSDTDADGLSDFAEVFEYPSNPLDPDTDADGLYDLAEIFVYLTNPLDPDTDADGYTDYAEVVDGTNPLDANDYPGKASGDLVILIIMAVVIGALAAVVGLLFMRSRKMSLEISKLKEAMKKRTVKPAPKGK